MSDITPYGLRASKGFLFYLWIIKCSQVQVLCTSTCEICIPSLMADKHDIENQRTAS